MRFRQCAHWQKQSMSASLRFKKAYEDLQRDGFIETTVGRGSFVSAQNKEFYQEEQQRIAEEHLQAAAEIGRTSNISLEKLTELLAMFYREDE